VAWANLTARDKKRIVELYKSGTSVHLLSKKYHCGAYKISDLLRQNNVEIRDQMAASRGRLQETKMVYMPSPTEIAKRAKQLQLEGLRCKRLQHGPTVAGDPSIKVCHLARTSKKPMVGR